MKAVEEEDVPRPALWENGKKRAEQPKGLPPTKPLSRCMVGAHAWLSGPAFPAALPLKCGGGPRDVKM